MPRIACLLLLGLLFISSSLAQTGQLANISTRAQVLNGNDVMIAGFIISGGQQTVVVRARGPSLIPFGITNALFDPLMSVVRASDQTTIASNDDWPDASNASALSALGFAPSNGLESALLLTLNPGAYTAVVSGYSGLTGVAIVEVFAVPPNPNLLNSERLLGGTWTFIYTIISTFQDQYMLTALDPVPGSAGQYFVDGIDGFGGPVVAMYYPPTSNWSLLDPGSIIDKFYVFTFSDNNHVSGCYYQISPPGSTNLSQCYAMAGNRFPSRAFDKALAAPGSEDQLLKEAAATGQKGFVQAGAAEAYLQARARFLEK